VAPLTMRKRFCGLIDREIEHANAGRPAKVVVKMNQLEDLGIIKRLYKASRAGVEVTALVRGFCCLRPGVPGLSDNIRIISIIGRYLEHSRIFHFANGSDDPLEGDWFIGSADWMSRNLSNRVEAVMPVHDGAARSRLWQILEAGLRDHRCAWVMSSDGDYGPLTPAPGMGEQTPEVLGTFETLCRAAAASMHGKPRGDGGEPEAPRASFSAGLG
jgi:polyphosphate kinase